MKKELAFFFSILLVLLALDSSFAGVDGEENLEEESVAVYEITHDRHYKTWTVTEVTAETIALERTKITGEKDQVEIDRSRRPHLKVGDRVRYDKIRNRLRKTITGGS